MGNSEGKSHDTILYMIVNLDNHDAVYISKDTPIVYIHDEDISCEYLEVNEIVQTTEGINWQQPRKCKIVTPDLVYSPTKVTEHCRMELKDHNTSEKTKQQ